MRKNEQLTLLIEERPVESFEQLDSLLRVVTIPQWLFLSVLFLILISLIMFSCFYKAPLKVDGRGIILEKYLGEGDPLLQVTAPAAGRLKVVCVNIGDLVTKGDVLAEIDQSELRDQIREVEAELIRLNDEDERLTEFDKKEAQSRFKAIDELSRRLHENLKLDYGRLSTARAIVKGDLHLNRQRMLGSIDTLKSRGDSDAIQSAIGTQEARLSELEFERIQDQTTRDREKLKRTLAINASTTKLRILNERLARETRVISPYAGKVVDLTVTPHALIEKGAPAALLQPLAQANEPPMEAIVFVPAGLGKKIKLGATVEVAPDTVRRQEHGFVRGVVESISEIPATELAMLAELKHKTLVSSFVAQYTGQVLLSIHVKLKDIRETEYPADADRLNWLEWSSRSGGNQRVTTGTLCAASIVVDRRRLIALAIPWVKELVGIY